MLQTYAWFCTFESLPSRNHTFEALPTPQKRSKKSYDGVIGGRCWHHMTPSTTAIRTCPGHNSLHHWGRQKEHIFEFFDWCMTWCKRMRLWRPTVHKVYHYALILHAWSNPVSSQLPFQEKLRKSHISTWVGSPKKRQVSKIILDFPENCLWLAVFWVDQPNKSSSESAELARRFPRQGFGKSTNNPNTKKNSESVNIPVMPAIASGAGAYQVCTPNPRP